MGSTVSTPEGDGIVNDLEPLHFYLCHPRDLTIGLIHSKFTHTGGLWADSRPLLAGSLERWHVLKLSCCTRIWQLASTFEVLNSGSA